MVYYINTTQPIFCPTQHQNFFTKKWTDSSTERDIRIRNITEGHHNFEILLIYIPEFSITTYLIDTIQIRNITHSMDLLT